MRMSSTFCRYEVPTKERVMTHIYTMEAEAKMKAKQVAADAVAAGYSINLMIDFWQVKKYSALGVMMSTLQKTSLGCLEKVELLVGFYDSRFVVHDHQYVLNKLDLCLDGLGLTWSNIASITCDGGLSFFFM